MSVKRRDNKNRILRNGESQRKDGRYAYVYVDTDGKQKFLYSWKLEETDRLPQEKRDCVSLRTKIKNLKKDIDDGIRPNGDGLTVLELVEKYTSQKNGVRSSTKAGYDYAIQITQKDSFGRKRIDQVKLSDVKQWFIKMQKNGKSYSTICRVRGVLKPAFQMAVDDDLIRKNPFDFPLSTIVINDSKAREALTEDQQEKFLDFVKNDSHFSQYYDAIYILFHTGLRISEFTGLLESNIDFDNRKIIVNHQLLRRSVNHHMEFYIEDTKTAKGVREVPMTKDVAECFLRIIKRRNKTHNDFVIDGMRGFIFQSKNNGPLSANHWQNYFEGICKKYNKCHGSQKLKVTPHVCRHTFCTNMARHGMNPKTLQYIMGHSNISITLDVYTHIGYDDAQMEMERVYGNMETY